MSVAGESARGSVERSRLAQDCPAESPLLLWMICRLFLLIALAAVIGALVPKIDEAVAGQVQEISAPDERTLPEPEDYTIVPSRQKTELEKFASWFGQDWELIYPNFYEGARMYFGQLSEQRRIILRRELSEFIVKSVGLPSETIEESWFKLGAQAWQPDLVIMPVLKDFLWMLSADH
jgi:hypothetical protein